MDPKRTVRDGYDAIAADYADARTVGGRGAELAASLANALPEGALVLDAGCGSGGPATVELDFEHDVVGLDASRGQVDHLRRHLPGVRPVLGDLTDLPFPDGAFDALVSTYAVIHVPRERHGDVLREFHRVLRPGGDALVVLGTEAWEGRNPDWLDTGVEMFWSFHDAERSLELVVDAGFDLRLAETVNDELGGDFLFVRASA